MSTSIEDLVALSQTDQQLLISQRSLEKLKQKIMVAREPLNQYETKIQEIKEQQESNILVYREAQKKFGEEDLFISKVESLIPLIRTPKEFNARKKELEEARKRRGSAENELLESEIKKEEFQKEMNRLQEDWSQAKDAFEKDITDLVLQKSSTMEKLNRLKKCQVDLKAKLDASLGRQYQNSRQRGIFPAICPVVNKACSGCNSVLPPQMFNEMIANSDKHRNCPFCYRIIFYLADPR